MLTGLLLLTGNSASGEGKTPLADFHVAMMGKDTNPGTADKPFATIAQTREAVRAKIKAGLTKDILVQIRGGTYAQTGVLSYWPRLGEDLSTWEFVVPIVQKTLLSLAGTRERPVENLHFRGIHVEHVDWPLPEEGYMGLFSNNVPLYREGGNTGHRFIDGAVEVLHSRSCSFRDGGIRHAGGMGPVLREGTANIIVEGNLD